MKQALIILNPSSGKEKARTYGEQASRLLEDIGYTVAVKETQKEFDATSFCIEACEKKIDLVVSLGGDGTLHETINGMIDQTYRPKLAVIPLGTVNDFARALHIPLQPEKAIDMLRSTTTRRADIGRINDQLFINVVAAGQLATSLSEVPSEDKSKLGFFAYVKEGIKTFAGDASCTMSVEYDEQTWEGRALLFIAALTNSVGGFEQLAPSAEIDDGYLHCFIIQDTNLLNTAAVGTSLLAGTLEHSKYVHAFKAKRVHVSAESELTTNVDGESGMSLPVTIELVPSYIDVLVPLNK
ncbi:diacylglycerol/lipid kinase family protein [Shouchella hunanensis]|uniref:Diacylglycerol kinase family lipid kinase n=1 Tax=Shouchella hunanensis TaxID=766894 RepID=A0ABY7W407_9BACI|nr:diacylglycerol kinase family protein [Shouchella hunanensis]WDF02650.1 diacylglycerol kinase family lipid kinase [Shouchella hunanensis]